MNNAILSNELKYAHGQRDDARVQHDLLAKGLHRAKQFFESSRDKLRSCEAACEADEAEQGKQLAAQLVAGNPSEAMSPYAADDLALALHSAKSEAAIAANALAAVQIEHDNAQKEFNRTEKTVVEITRRILHSEAASIAVDIIRLDDEIGDLAIKLWGYGIESQVDLKDIPPFSKAIELLNRRVDWVNTPINQLQGARVCDTDAWATRREALIAGEQQPAAKDSRAA